MVIFQPLTSSSSSPFIYFNNISNNNSINSIPNNNFVYSQPAPFSFFNQQQHQQQQQQQLLLEQQYHYHHQQQQQQQQQYVQQQKQQLVEYNMNDNIKKRKQEEIVKHQILPLLQQQQQQNPFDSSSSLQNLKSNHEGVIIFQHQPTQDFSSLYNNISTTSSPPTSSLQLQQNISLHPSFHQYINNENNTGSSSSSSSSSSSNKRHQFQNKDGVIKYNQITPNVTKEKSFTDEIKSSLKADVWRSHLSKEFEKPYFKSLFEFLEAEKESGIILYPPVEYIFHAFNLTDLDRVKIVILGQDPYHGTDQANGLSFSVGVAGKRPLPLIPAAINNIFTELQSDLGVCKNVGHGNLERWAKQGVLLLNTCLTVRKGTPESHSNRGWETFTDEAISILNKERSGIIFFLWGKHAQQKASLIDATKHKILTASHPSTFSAAKGFYGCRHFSIANNLLLQSSKTPIDWELSDIDPLNNNNSSNNSNSTNNSVDKYNNNNNNQIKDKSKNDNNNYNNNNNNSSMNENTNNNNKININHHDDNRS